MPASPQDLFARLDGLNIDHETIDHPPIFTVEEGRDHKLSMPGGHSKNLFLKDKKGNFALASAWCDTAVNLVALGKHLGARGRFSFGKPDVMEALLGVSPGSVTPFSLMNAPADAFAWVVVDAALMGHEAVWFHPLHNAASTRIAPDDLVRFIEKCGFQPLIVDFDRLSAPELPLSS